MTKEIWYSVKGMEGKYEFSSKSMIRSLDGSRVFSMQELIKT